MCEHGTVKIVKLNRPREVSGRSEVPVDACIADEVQALNDDGIVTLGSCCGHGQNYAHVLIDEKSVELVTRLGYTTSPYYHGPNDYRGVHEVMLKEGERVRTLLQFKLVARSTDAVSAIVETS